MVAASELPPESIPASASPIRSDRVGTIRMTLSVSLLTAPNANGTIRLEAPRNMIAEGTFFALRYYVNGRARRSVVQTVRTTAASAIRDIVSVRLISDTSIVERNARRESLGVEARLQRSPGDSFSIEIADGSRSGVGFNSHVPLQVGEVVVLTVPGDQPISAEIAIVRAEPNEAVCYGAQYTDAEAGGALFAAMVGAIWRGPPPRAATAHQEADDGAAPGAATPAPGGMRARRHASG